MPWLAPRIQKRTSKRRCATRKARAGAWKWGDSHAWGKMYCPLNDAECRCGEFCIACIWSTPKNATNHARALRRVVDHCSAQKVMLDIMRKAKG